MNLLAKPDTRNFILLIGKGLIGGACCEEFIRCGYRLLAEERLTWGSTDCLQDEVDSFFGKIEVSGLDQPRLLKVLWSAGKAGFSSGEHEVAKEFADFKSVISEVTVRNLKVELYFVSSAGGVHEGQTLADETSPESPLRPYGWLKCQQEQLIKSLPIKKYAIFRPSSVFGNISVKTRMGLIPRLIYNGILHQQTRIIGKPETLRDFIYVRHLANEISCRMHSDESKGSTKIVCSGKPSTIFEIQSYVEKVIGRKLYLIFAEPENALDMTYRYRGTEGANPESDNLYQRIKSIYLDWQYGLTD